MLENSNLLEGSTAKRVNELIAEYEDIRTRANDLETSKKKVLAELFELAPVGVNETSKYSFNIVNNSGAVKISTKGVREKAPELYGQLVEMGFVSVGEDYLTVRGIKLKGKRS